MNTTTVSSEDASPKEEAPPTFDLLDLTPPTRKAIADIGWETPTPVQLETFALAVAGEDLIVQSRTGTGKTAAFGLPLVDRLVTEEKGVQALILAPTRELALQSAREITRLGQHRNITTTAVYGGAPIDKQVRELDAGAQIVSGTPGRVLDHLRRGTLDASGLKVLVLDEADEMLSMGFAKELHSIMELLPKTRQTLLFSATVDGPVQRVGERHMTDPKIIELSGDAVGALGVTHHIFMINGKGRAKDLVRVLETENPESAIVFCNTKAETEQVAAHLQSAGYSADWLNGDLAQSDREKVMGRTREGKLRFLVATDVAARGIDVSHLTHVINYALPDHLEQYIHRTGRTGRAGRTGTAISLVAPQELGTLYYLRLQYKIFPIERSLPSQGEERTRKEMDRVEMLQEAFKTTSELDLAVARRLLTHGRAEDIIAGLLGSFFGTQGEDKDVDEVAAAARREREPRPVEEPKLEATTERKPRRAKRSERDEEPRRAKRSERDAEPRRAKRSERDEEPRRAKRSERDEEPRRASPTTLDESVVPSSESNGESVEEPQAERPRRARRDESNGDREPRRPRRDESDGDREPRRSRRDESDEDRDARRARRDEERDDVGEDETKLYVGLGRKDGVRVGEINRLFIEEAGLEREEVGRIRLRDKHSFVCVPTTKHEDVIEALDGFEHDGRELKVEVAKSQGSS